MTITGIRYRFISFSRDNERSNDVEIPFTGDDLTITNVIRSVFGTEVKRYSSSEETVKKFMALIDKYDITGWAGKTPSAPEAYDDDHTHTASFLTLRFEDGTAEDITFREVSEDTGNKAAEEFRILFFDSAKNENLISQEKQYPSLEQCRSIKEEHGPVIAVETRSSSSGMMMNSDKTVTETVERVKYREGTVLVTIRKKDGNFPEESGSAEITSDIIKKIQELSDRENLPSWNYAQTDPSAPADPSMMVYDHSSSSCINIYYDDSLITGCPRVKRTIGGAARSMGGAEVEKTIEKLIGDLVNNSGITVKASESGGTWTCRNCGTSGLTTKFCMECGSPRS